MAESKRIVPLVTLMDHAPSPGGCRCGWRGVDLMEHVEQALRRDVEAAGLQWRDEEADRG